MGDTSCIFCAGSGKMGNGMKCSCGAVKKIILPTSLKVPLQYQEVRFDSSFLRPELQGEYGSYMMSLMNECTESILTFQRNVLICAPPNAGKTVWAYTVQGMLYGSGTQMPDLMDIMEARNLLLSYYDVDKDKTALLSKAPLAIIKLPMDLPNKFPETISMIIERRVRNNGSTIFMFNGDYKDLEAQDRFGKMAQLKGSGNYNSIEIKSFKGGSK